MSVLIKGIKMPQDCPQCGACAEDEDGINYCGYDDDVRAVKLFNCKRPAWCPAVNVSTDGRLYTEDDVRRIINGTVAAVEYGTHDPYDILPSDFV